MMNSTTHSLNQTAATVDPLVPQLFRVTKVRNEIDEVKSLDMIPLDGQFTFQAGQFNMVYGFGVGEVPISISSRPDASKNQITHTIRSVGLATEALCQIKAGAILGVRGPYGSYWPIEEHKGKDFILIAGGLGLAPVRPALLELLYRRDQFGRVILLYGARTPADLLFQSELLKWRSRFDLEVLVTVDRADPSWKGNVGVVPALMSRVKLNSEKTIAFICGPEIMMRFSLNPLLQEGLKLDQIYVSLERNMKCATGLCGHCQFGPTFICKDGPIFPMSEINHFFKVQEM